MTCSHKQQQGRNFMPVGEAMLDKAICWTGMVIAKCGECAADVSRLRLVEVKTVNEVLNEQ